MDIITRVRAHPARTAAVVLVTALLVGGVVRVTRFSNSDIPDQTRDPAKLAAATTLIAGLPTPEHAVRDVYATACRAPALFCATSTTRDARSLMSTVERDLRSQGAQVKDDKCSPKKDDELLPVLPNCGATLIYRGALINVRAGDVQTGPASAPAYVFAVVTTDGLTTEASNPLPALAILNIAPVAWKFTAPCLAPDPSGCRHYSGTVSLTGVVDSLNAQLLGQLTARGYAIDMTRCRLATGQRACTLAARRFRTIGGRDSVTVVAVLRQTDPKTVSVRISAQSS